MKKKVILVTIIVTALNVLVFFLYFYNMKLDLSNIYYKNELKIIFLPKAIIWLSLVCLCGSAGIPVLYFAQKVMYKNKKNFTEEALRDKLATVLVSFMFSTVFSFIMGRDLLTVSDFTESSFLFWSAVVYSIIFLPSLFCVRDLLRSVNEKSRIYMCLLIPMLLSIFSIFYLVDKKKDNIESFVSAHIFKTIPYSYGAWLQAKPIELNSSKKLLNQIQELMIQERVLDVKNANLELLLIKKDSITVRSDIPDSLLKIYINDHIVGKNGVVLD